MLMLQMQVVKLSKTTSS